MDITEMLAAIKIPATVFHVISVVFGMGAALVSDLLFTFYSQDRRLDPTERKTLETLSAVVWYSLLAISFSGLLLFFSDTTKYLASHKFLAKMTILGVLVVNGFVLNKLVWPHLAVRGFFTAKRETSARKLAFVGGAISVTSWVSVCALGVLDKSPAGYSTIMLLYALAVAIAICAALLIENREFERNQ